MKNYFKKDFKRAFFSKYNLIAIMLVFLIAIIEIYFNLSENQLRNNSISLMIAILNGGRIALLTLLCPLIICIPYVTSYLQDEEYGFINFLISRFEKREYLKVRIIVNAIISFLVMFLPLIIIYIVLLITKDFPINNFLEEKGISGLFTNIAYKYPIFYPIFSILGFSLFGATYGTFALGLSTIIKNKYLSLIIPNVIYIGTTLITPLIGASFKINFDLNLINLVDISLSNGILSFILYHLILVFIGIYLFYIKALQKEQI